MALVHDSMCTSHILCCVPFENDETNYRFQHLSHTWRMSRSFFFCFIHQVLCHIENVCWSIESIVHLYLHFLFDPFFSLTLDPFERLYINHINRIPIQIFHIFIIFRKIGMKTFQRDKNVVVHMRVMVTKRQLKFS